MLVPASGPGRGIICAMAAQTALSPQFGEANESEAAACPAACFLAPMFCIIVHHGACNYFNSSRRSSSSRSGSSGSGSRRWLIRLFLKLGMTAAFIQLTKSKLCNAEDVFQRTLARIDQCATWPIGRTPTDCWMLLLSGAHLLKACLTG